LRDLNLNNKNILIYGLGISGKAAFNLAKLKKANVFLYDDNIDVFENVEVLKKIDEVANLLDLIIISPGIKPKDDFLKLAEKYKIKIWSEVELAYQSCSNDFIAITGTNGKTTTTSLVGEIIKKSNPGSQICGNIGFALSAAILEIKNKNNFIVAEISNYQLENIEEFKPKISVILNLTVDHLDRHKTFENYVEVKKRIFANQNANDFLIINHDDIECKKIYKNFKEKLKIFLFSTQEKLSNGVYFLNNNIYYNNKKILSCDNIKLPGMHNISNICAAIAICLCTNVDLKIIQDVIKNFSGIEHRLEFVKNIDGVKFYNDSKATNISSACKALESFENKNIILIGGGYDKHIDFYLWIKKIKEIDIKYLILIGETKNKIKKQCDELNFKNYLLCEKFEEAICKAFSLAKKDYYVLLSPACASWDMFDNYEQRGNIFKNIVHKF
jgi:UDP-N-acetylmuramoylalanine--D-glutamate ligase